MTDRERPSVAVTLGDPRGIGPEVADAALRGPALGGQADFLLVGPGGVLDDPPARLETVGAWDAGAPDPDALAGDLSVRAVDRALELVASGEADGIVTAPLSKESLAAAGHRWPGHTELLRERTGVTEVTMMMAAEETPAGGPLRMALLTGHVALRDVPARLTLELAVRRSRIAARALRGWWGLGRPRLAFAGLNPHASEGGLFGDEEARILRPAADRIEAEGEAVVDGIYPADTVFRRCLSGSVDAVVVPYHDVGLAVIKTLALEQGVNVTAGLPFPRTSPDHGTARDIAGTGRADPSSMAAALELCVRFCRRARAAEG